MPASSKRSSLLKRCKKDDKKVFIELDQREIFSCLKLFLTISR
jgi:hypothetical protein